MTRPTDIFLCDINGLGYAAMYQPNLARLQHEGFATGGLLGAINSLFKRMAEIPHAVPVVIWDGHASWRKDLYPAYKANRSDDPDKRAIRDAYRSQVPYIQLLLNRLGIPQVRCHSAEADDVAGLICREIDPSWNLELDSKDSDWWQGLAQNIHWYSPTTGKTITLESLADPENGMSDGHFLSPSEYLQAKALAGDSSDFIAGVEKVGLKTATKLMRENGGTMESFWAKVDDGWTPKGVVATRVAETKSREMYARNSRLMDWRLAPDLDTGDLAITVGQPDWGDVEGICGQFGLKSLPTRAKEILGPRGRPWGRALDAVMAALHHKEVQPVPRIA